MFLANDIFQKNYYLSPNNFFLIYLYSILDFPQPCKLDFNNLPKKDNKLILYWKTTETFSLL